MWYTYKDTTESMFFVEKSKFSLSWKNSPLAENASKSFIFWCGINLNFWIPDYRWPENGSLSCDRILPAFFRKSTKRWLELDFWGVKNAWKSDENYAFWPAPRTIHRPRLGLQTGARNHAKSRQNASKITAKWARKNIHPGVAMVKNARRRLACENASKRVHFCSRHGCKNIE